MENSFILFFLEADTDPKSLTMMSASVIANIDPLDTALGSAERGAAVQNGKPRKKTMTSVYLKYFETALDGKSRRCKFCGQSYSIATATGYFSQPPYYIHGVF